MKLINHIADRIKELRNNYNSGEGLSQTKLAELMRVAPNTISRWETGNYKPSIEDLEKLSRILGVSILDFFPQEEEKNGEKQQINALFRAVKDLDNNDLEEVQKYAEFRKARSLYSRKKRPVSGRKRKEKE